MESREAATLKRPMTKTEIMAFLSEAREGINPFTKQETVFKAKPARNVMKITPLKGLKDMV